MAHRGNLLETAGSVGDASDEEAVAMRVSVRVRQVDGKPGA